MNKKFFIATASPYVNAAPHIGFAFEIIQADTLARYHRLINDDVYFLTGTDENSLKNVWAAEKQKIPVQNLVDLNANKFKNLKEVLNLSYDDFFRSTDKRHFEGVKKLWKLCQKDIYKKRYSGLYCVGCEAFYLKKDLIDGKCPEHKTKPELVEEENYFFRLSSYQNFLKSLIFSDELKIIPEIRKNELLSFINSGLEDFSISRSKKRAHGWGVPVPFDPDQIMYVWFDALAYYLTALDWQNKGKLFQKYWPVDVHLIGKGITRFHAIYWPAMLKSAGISTPKKIFAHGYLTISGQKISKSLGNTVDPFELIKEYQIDPIRYYLLREIPAYGDGDFSINRFKEVYNADLANGLGNLVARVAKLCQIYQKGSLEINSNEFYQEVEIYLENFQFDEALKFIWKKISDLDKYLETEKPWEKNYQSNNDFWKNLIQGIKEIAFNLKPFLPETAEKIKKQFSQPKIIYLPPLFKRLP